MIDGGKMRYIVLKLSQVVFSYTSSYFAGSQSNDFVLMLGSSGRLRTEMETEHLFTLRKLAPRRRGEKKNWCLFDIRLRLVVV